VGVSIYYVARRARPLSDDERAAIARLIADHDPGRFTAVGGEPFDVWERLEEGEVFAGSTGLPRDDAPDAITHWLALVTEIRHAVPDADWRVHLDGYDFPWNGRAYVLE
jgi:hypothetical protein